MVLVFPFWVLGWHWGCDIDVGLLHNSTSRKAMQNSCRNFWLRVFGWAKKLCCLLIGAWDAKDFNENEREREWEFCVTFSFFFGFRKGGHIDLTFFLITLKHNTISPLPSIGRWLHFMIASTACEILENSISPDDERSVFKGNRRTDVAGTSLMLKIPISWSSVKPGGVLKKCKI